MEVLVSDPSVLIDLERGQVLKPCFSLPFKFVVPNLLYDEELKDHGGAALLKLGLKIEKLDSAGLDIARRYQKMSRALTQSDSFALALAKTKSWILLSGDGKLRELALKEEVTCHGVLWVFDQMFKRGVVHRSKLLVGLKRISEHERCWLPKKEVQRRLRRYR